MHILCCMSCNMHDRHPKFMRFTGMLHATCMCVAGIVLAYQMCMYIHASCILPEKGMKQAEHL